MSISSSTRIGPNPLTFLTAMTIEVGATFITTNPGRH